MEAERRRCYQEEMSERRDHAAVNIFPIFSANTVIKNVKHIERFQ